MQRIDLLLSHVWMVRTFLKHCDEAAEDDELRDVHRGLYDYMLALGQAWKDQDAATYLKQAKKKLRRLKTAVELFTEIQDDVSSHTNFQMAASSRICVMLRLARSGEIRSQRTWTLKNPALICRARTFSQKVSATRGGADTYQAGANKEEGLYTSVL